MRIANCFTIGIWIFGDQLTSNHSVLQQVREQGDRASVILIEAQDLARQRPYHRQKLVLVWSAMRHFAEELRADGWPVTYEIAEDFLVPLQRWVAAEEIAEIWAMQPSDRPFARAIESLDIGVPLVWFPNILFLWSRDEFRQWASDRKRWLMEDFYRQGRKRFSVLMDGENPAGGKWNLDKENRKPPKANVNPPTAIAFAPDEITQAVIAEVNALDTPTYGQCEPFSWGVTREQAVAVLETFLSDRLPTFGPYQDAMVTGEPTMWHALISPYLNLGLLHPLDVVRAAETAYRERDLPLNSVEGFVRQVLGWREYMHGLYHYLDADYGDRNWFGHAYTLPAFFWDSRRAEMNCMRQVLQQIEATAYAHHIQRLMILSNFALVVGVSPQAVKEWFHAVFIDAYDWVMQTNVIGMGQFADGGILASKPYASSANYIHKMSDYCKNCRYDRRDRMGEKACPFNFFYWDFLARHREQLYSQGRMNLVLANLKKLPPEELAAMQALADEWRSQYLS